MCDRHTHATHHCHVDNPLIAAEDCVCVQRAAARQVDNEPCQRKSLSLHRQVDI